MKIKLLVNVGEVYKAGQVVKVCEDYKKEWKHEKGEIDIRLGDGSVYQLYTGEYKFI
ncbi:hypothetical protein [Sporosarcina sp. FSL W7-1283]|uniref:hypothetical protein n=1 Tax=Sporosarcina sp. FSL W7-1283 TaxID=2921560 RepID=UPI0030F9A3C3